MSLNVHEMCYEELEELLTKLRTKKKPFFSNLFKTTLKGHNITNPKRSKKIRKFTTEIKPIARNFIPSVNKKF